MGGDHTADPFFTKAAARRRAMFIGTYLRDKQARSRICARASPGELFRHYIPLPFRLVSLSLVFPPPCPLHTRLRLPLPALFFRSGNSTLSSALC